jgi:hypothetical protein
MASTLQDDSPRDLVLYKESMMVKFNEHVIIRNKAKNREEIFANVGYMEDVFKTKR